MWTHNVSFANAKSFLLVPLCCSFEINSNKNVVIKEYYILEMFKNGIFFYWSQVQGSGSEKTKQKKNPQKNKNTGSR